MRVAISLCPVLSYILWTESIIVQHHPRVEMQEWKKPKRNHHELHSKDKARALQPILTALKANRGFPFARWNGSKVYFQAGNR